MAEVRLNQYLATVRVTLSEDIVLQHSPSSPTVIGQEMANQVHEYVKSRQIGYYPALDYFLMDDVSRDCGIDPDLFDALDSMSWLVSRLTRNEIQQKLRQVFSSVKFQTVQTIAYTMPAVRISNANALHDLAQHYSPLTIKLELLLSMISKREFSEGVETFISNALQRWLKDSFESIDVSSVVEVVSS